MWLACFTFFCILGIMFFWCFVANLIDGYCCFVNNCNGSFLLSKRRLREQQKSNGGVSYQSSPVQTRAHPQQTDSVDGAMIVRQRKFKVCQQLYCLCFYLKSFQSQDVRSPWELSGALPASFSALCLPRWKHVTWQTSHAKYYFTGALCV